MELRTNTIPPHGRLPSRGMHFFFALLPDAPARAEIAQARERFRKSHRLIGTPVDPEDLHLTLCEMGKPEWLEQSLESLLITAAEQVRVTSFPVALDSAMRLSAVHDNQYPFVLGTDNPSGAKALGLRRAIAEAQQQLGLRVAGVSSYLPHVTLLRGSSIDAVQESMTPISWLAREFVLIRSFFGQSRLEVIGRWPLVVEPEPERFSLADLDDLPELPGELDLFGPSSSG